ncbi:MAG TPA: hypothetical protein VFX98_00895 [Longimicrobiaceae bacterium]|nr:hypothetical protein [Longimicrobiaceae bacterium]
MLLTLALGFLAAAAPGDSSSGILRGSVQGELSGMPIPRAVVEVKGGDGTLTAFADSTGAYQLKVPAGRHRFRVHHLAYAPMEMEVLVPAGREVRLDVTLKERPIQLPAIGVRREGEPPMRDTTAAPPENLGLIGHVPARDGVTDFANGLGVPGTGKSPDGQEPPDRDDVLYVRGAAADLKLVLLDGVPVYAPFHMGGLIDTFEPGVLNSARMYLGGAPARYDGGLSYVMELNTRRGTPEGFHSSGALDLVSLRGTAEGPLPGGASFLLSGRGIHTASLAELEGQAFPYKYADGLARLDVPVDSVSHLALTLFTNAEGVRIDTFPSRENFARWGNRAVSLRYSGVLLRTRGQLTVAYSRFHAKLPWYRRSDPVRLDGETNRLRVAMDLARQWRGVRFLYGWSYDRTVLNHRATELFGDLDMRVDDQLAGDVGAGYVEAAFWPLPNRVSLRGGVRADMFSNGRMAAFSPRLEARWVMSDRAVLTLAGGRYHQFVRVHQELPETDQQLSMEDSLNLPIGLTVAGANHLSLALDQTVAEGVRLGLEGYYKHFEGLPASADIGANASGVDVWVRGRTAALSGWMGYSLSWVWDGPRENEDRERFAGRQLLSMGLNGEVKSLGRLGVRVAYGAGLPFTSIEANGVGQSPALPSSLSSEDRVEFNEDPPLTSVRAEPFLRVDAEVSRTFTPRIGSRRTELTPYLKVINALDGRDGLFYQYDLGDGDMDAIAALPLLPVFGLQWKF